MAPAAASLRGTLRLAALMVLGIAANFGLVFAVGEDHWVLFGASIPLSLGILWVSLRSAGVDFGGPELSCEQHAGEIVKAVPSFIFNGLGDFLRLHVRATDLPVYLLKVSLHVVTILNVRGAGLVVNALAHVLQTAFIVAGIHVDPKNQNVFVVLTLSMAISSAAGVCTKYMHDQRLVVGIASVQIVGGISLHRYLIHMPSYLDKLLVVAFFYGLAFYLILIFQRRLRSLPPALGALRFLRLGFIRGDAGCSGPIVRSQDMPAGAFGDVGKAMRVISASHRWLDRDTCDLGTPAFPMGLRLGTMRRVANSHLSPTRAEEPSFARRLRHALGRRAVGGWDAVVFFDFAGLPQAPRSEDEERVFRQCLPHMGMMYSMFPTMVLHEVTPGTHGYLESGWCFCELETARLGRQLSEYSLDAVRALGRTPEADGSLASEGDLEGFISTLEAELEQKVFHFPSDSDAVRGIIHAFALKRMVLDAIEGGDTAQLSSVIARLQARQLAQPTLEQPVNRALDTPLHVAVRKGNVAAAKILLDSGANPARRNLRGDVPHQCFMFPRCSKAARVVRAAAPRGRDAGEVIGRATAESAAP